MKVSSTYTGLSKTRGSLGKLHIGLVSIPAIAPIAFDIELSQKINLDEQELKNLYSAKIASISSELATAVEKALTQALQSSVWDWKDGARDIYDTGALARSVRVAVDEDGLGVSYMAPYANLVHNGGYIHPYGNLNARPVYMPARPWVASVLFGGGPVPQFDFGKFVEQRLG